MLDRLPPWVRDLLQGVVEAVLVMLAGGPLWAGLMTAFIIWACTGTWEDDE